MTPQEKTALNNPSGNKWLIMNEGQRLVNRTCHGIALCTQLYVSKSIDKSFDPETLID